MWLTRQEYAALLKAAAVSTALEARIHDLDKQLAEARAAVKFTEDRLYREQARADNAVDALLERIGQVNPVSPDIPQRAFEDAFAEDPEEVKRLTALIAERGPVAAFAEMPS